MNTSLRNWLTEHREALLARWHMQVELQSFSMVPANGHAPTAGLLAEQADERTVLLGSLYDGLVSAADDDYSVLNECLRHLHALRSQPGEHEFAQNLSLPLQLRHAVRDLLAEVEASPALLTQLDELIDYTTLGLAKQWTSAADMVRRELNETKLLVESLYHDAEATDRTTLQVSNLNEIAQGLASSMDRAQQLEIVGEKLRSTLEIAMLAVWLLEPASAKLTLAHQLGAASPSAAGQPVQIDTNDPSDIVALTFRFGDMLIETELDPAAQQAWYQPGFAVLCVPMIAQGQTIGVIAMQDANPTTLLDRSQQAFVKSAASQAAIALENTRLYNEVLSFNNVLEHRIAERTRELQIERDTLETVNQIAIETTSTLDRDSLLEASLSALAQLVNVEYGSIMLVEQETDHLIDATVLNGHASDRGYTRFRVGQGIAGWVAQNKRAAVIDDITTDPRWVELPDVNGERRKKSGSLIAVPLIAHHQTLGVLMLSHEQTGYFNEDHLRLMTASAGQIAIGINNAQLYTELEKELMHRSEMFQRQESEASQSQAILQSLTDGVIVCGEDGAVLTANMACERILERSIEELVIWNLPELLRRLLGRRADELPVADLLAQPIDDKHRPRTYSAVFQMGTRMISIALGPVLNSKESLIGAVAVFRDITREIESDRLKTEFIGTVSHELRTPMTSIKGFTQLLSMGSLGPVNDTQKEFLQIIQTNAERMISIINDLLDITKIETGSVELDMRPLHLAEALSTVMLELQAPIREREHELSISIPPGLPLVRADSRRLNQIIGNVLSNAVKYTPRGGKIALEAREVGLEAVPELLREGLRPQTRYALVEVRDSGVGIAAEDVERIFERFYRSENPLKVEAGGTGLGLSLVRPLIELFGGRIWVRSALGEGSTFSLLIPAA